MLVRGPTGLRPSWWPDVRIGWLLVMQLSFSVPALPLPLLFPLLLPALSLPPLPLLLALPLMPPRPPPPLSMMLLFQDSQWT